MSSIKEIAKAQSSGKVRKDGRYKVIAALIVLILVLLAMMIPQSSSASSSGIMAYLFRAYYLLLCLVRMPVQLLYNIIYNLQ